MKAYNNSSYKILDERGIDVRAILLSLGFALLFTFGVPVNAQENLMEFSEELNQVFLTSLDEETTITLDDIDEWLEEADEVHDYEDGAQKLYTFEDEDYFSEVLIDLLDEDGTIDYLSVNLYNKNVEGPDPEEIEENFDALADAAIDEFKNGRLILTEEVVEALGEP